MGTARIRKTAIAIKNLSADSTTIMNPAENAVIGLGKRTAGSVIENHSFSDESGPENVQKQSRHRQMNYSIFIVVIATLPIFFAVLISRLAERSERLRTTYVLTFAK